MYYFVYVPLYLISLLPFRLLYIISDLAYFILFYIIGYRKQIVLNNLNIAFPDFEIAKKQEIAKQFYKNFVDNFIETIKLLSISDTQFDKRISINLTQCNELAKYKNLQVHSGHQMNWEYAHLAFARNMKTLWVGVYMQINNKHVDRLFLKVRRKFNSLMVPTKSFSKDIRNVYEKKYALALIADQNPGIPKNAYWLNFFDHPAPFMAGAEKGAIRNNTAVVFVNFVRLQRGHYLFEPTIITENAAEYEDGELTRLYRDYLEACIRRQPANYLWSHRRWKWEFKPEYKKRWIDKIPAPL